MADAATISVLLQVRDQASRQLEQVQGKMNRLAAGVQNNAQTFRRAGLALTGIGAGITGLLGLTIKSSQEQQIGVNRLNQSLKNVGTSYLAQKDAIEQVIEAQQRKTNFGDEAQRDALQKLVTIGGRWEGSLDALRITTDVAAGANIDLSAAALLVGKAIAGETSSLSRYGILLEKGATQTEIMAALTRQFGGAAEAAADPFTQLKNRIGDLLQEIGDALLPTVQAAVVRFEEITRQVIDWTAAHPELTKFLAIAAAAVGGLALVLGPLLILLPGIIAGISAMGAALTIATGPVGLIALAIAGLTVAGVLLVKNWDKVWATIRSVTEKAVNFLIKLLNGYTAIYRGMVATMLEGVQKVVGFIPKIGDSMKESLDVAIKALRAGIPEIDITEEKVKGLADTTADTSREVEIVTADIAKSFEGMGDAVEDSLEDTGAKLRAFNAKALQATIDAASKQAGARDRIEARNRQFRKDVADRMLAEAQVFEDQRLAILQTNLEAESDARERARDAFIAANKAGAAAQVAAREAEAAELARINEQIAKDAADQLQRMTNSWAAFELSLNPIIASMEDKSLGFGDVVKLLAADFGLNTQTMIGVIKNFGSEFGDTLGLVEQFGQAKIQSIIDSFGGLKEAINEVISRQDQNAAARAANVAGQRASAQVDVDTFQRQIQAAGAMGAPIPVSLLEGLERAVNRLNSLRSMATGGVVPGAVGSPQMILAHGGETVTPAGRAGAKVLNLTVNMNAPSFESRATIGQAVRDIANEGGFDSLFG